MTRSLSVRLSRTIYFVYWHDLKRCIGGFSHAKKIDQRYQRILWRDNSDETVTYELNTVTFGLSSAPFLVMRCIDQVADDEGDTFPRVTSILKEDMYVDNLLTGADLVAISRILDPVGLLGPMTIRAKILMQ